MTFGGGGRASCLPRQHRRQKVMMRFPKTISVIPLQNGMMMMMMMMMMRGVDDAVFVAASERGDSDDDERFVLRRR